MSGKKNRKKINKQKRRQIAAAVIAIILALAMVVPLLVVTVSAAESGSIAGALQTAGDVVQDGITLEGVDLSGKTREDVQAVADSVLESRKNATITLHGNTDDEKVTVSAGNLGMIWGNAEVVDQIIGYGHAANIIARY